MHDPRSVVHESHNESLLLREAANRVPEGSESVLRPMSAINCKQAKLQKQSFPPCQPEIFGGLRHRRLPHVLLRWNLTGREGDECVD
jgi:hypothetical protein